MNWRAEVNDCSNHGAWTHSVRRLLRASAFYSAIYLLFFIVAWQTGVMAQEIDETRHNFSDIRAQLVWENVTDSAQFVTGVRPKFSIQDQLSVVRLGPGESTDILVPGNELVRVVSACDQALDESEVQVWVSNGSGLYRRQVSAVSTDGRSMLVSPGQPGVSICKVMRPVSATNDLCVAVFTSRRATPKILDPYRCKLYEAGKPVRIRDDRGSKTRGYSQLKPSTRYQVNLRGPNRVRFETRLIYGNDQEFRQTYWLRVYVNGELHRVVTVDTEPTLSHRVFVDECERLIGRREFAYFDFGSDEQQVEIESSHPVYLRAEGVGLNLLRPSRNQNFDLPGWVNPLKTASFWNSPEFDPASSALSRSFLNETITGQESKSTSLPVSLDPMFDPYLNLQRIQQIARNNEIPHGGLRAYMWMRAIATRHQTDVAFGDEISVPEMATRIRHKYTRYVDLLPESNGSSMRTEKSLFAIRKLRDPKQARTQTVVGEQHIPSAIRGLAQSFFVTQANPDNETAATASSGRDVSLRYMVPPQLGPSLLRIAVDQTNLKSAKRIFVQYDQREPMEFAVLQNPLVGPKRFVPSRAEAAISALGQVSQKYDSGVVGAPFAQFRNPLPVVRAATLETLLPGGIRQIRIWSDGSLDDTTRIAVQYLDGRPTILSEASRLYQVGQIGSVSEPVEAPDATNELLNEAVDLRRFLKSNWLLIRNSVAPSDQLRDAESIWQQEKVDQHFATASSREKEKQWAAAIELYTRVIRNSSGLNRRRAILKRCEALERSGEPFLASRERRGWFCFSDDIELKHELLQQVAAQAIETGDETILESYLAYFAVETEDPAVQLLLAEEMVNQGRYHMALLTLPDVTGSDVDRIALRCCLQLGWWKTFDRILNQVEDVEDKNLWRGLQSLRQGRYQRAHRILQAAGAKGQTWLNHWEQAHLIFELLKSKDHRVRRDAVSQWQKWQSLAPGHWLWKLESEHVKQFAGGAIVSSDIRKKRMNWFRAEPGRPATIRICGPVQLRIEVRPMHDPDLLNQPQSGWLGVHGARFREQIPYFNNLVSQHLRVHGSDMLPGTRELIELEIPAGLNEFELATNKDAVLFRVHVKRPEIASTVLPWVNEPSLSAIVKGSLVNETSNAIRARRLTAKT